MLCDIIVSDKMGSIPVTECGGIFIAPGDKLLVRAGMGKKMKEVYGPLIIVAGQEEKFRLRNGHYELIAGNSRAAIHSTMLGKSSDRSMIGKFKKVFFK